MRKFYCYLLSLLIFGFLNLNVLYAQIPSGYYNSASGLTSLELKQALHNIIDNHDAQSYASLWDHFEFTDAKSNGDVWDMYSNCSFDFGSDQCGSYSVECDCYNREHSFPASWFNDASPMYTDLFHLVPTDGKVNGVRSNYPFGEVSSATYTSTNGSKLGSCNYPGYSGTVFEPIDEYKGDFARNYLYMSVRYMDVFDNFSSPMISGDDFADWAINMLLEWHELDPVSDKEIDRNEAVYDIQGNRNPFIDHPEYAPCIWLGICGNEPSIDNIAFSPLNPTATDQVTVSATITDDGSITEALLEWCTDGTSFNYSVTMNNTSGDNYYASIPAQSTNTNVYFRISATDNENNTTLSSVAHYVVGQTLVTLLNVDFQVCPPDDWQFYSVACSDRDWQCDASGFAGINAYGGNEAADDWIITNELDLSGLINPVLSFETWTKYTDITYPQLKVLYSNNYTGIDDPTFASWTELSYTASPENSETWTSSGQIDLSQAIDQQIYIAYQYTSSGNGSGSSSWWKLDNILLTAETNSVFNFNSSQTQIVAPNPNNGRFKLNLPNPKHDYKVVLLNQQSQKIFQTHYVPNSETSFLWIDVQSLNAGIGMYFLQLIDLNDDLSRTYKVLIIQ